ncbi:MAG: hypothetical protein GY822_14140 [Deltaproteobacteria bacterium]|nr:hypothetical protein [Deltaproteobacteria bacterium]
MPIFRRFEVPIYRRDLNAEELTLDVLDVNENVTWSARIRQINDVTDPNFGVVAASTQV